MIYASEFSEILTALTNNLELRARVLVMIQTKPLCCPVIEEEERAKEFRSVLMDLVNGEILDLEFSYEKLKEKIPQESSKYKNNAEIFQDKWNENVIRLHLSRFYNHAVLEELKENKKEECVIPEASVKSDCVLGQNHKYNVLELMENLVNYYDLGHKETILKIPEHPRCPHVVKPIEYAKFVR